MIEAGLEEVRSITQQMRVNAGRAITICQEVGEEILDEDRHEFWALVKYVENVQEAIVQLDRVLPSSSVGEESLSPNHPDTSSRF